MKSFIFFAVPLFLVGQRLAAQSFQNLNFESANLSAEQGVQQWPNLVPITSALPGWSAYLGDVQQTMVGQNTYALSVATVDVLGPGWGTQSGPLGGSIGIIDGNYSVLLQGGITPDSPNSEYVSASIAQTGTIPAYAQSLTFKAWEIYPSTYNTFSVSFDGINLSPSILSTGTSSSGQPYNIYGVDMASYAGDTGQLEFTSDAGTEVPSLLLDDIKFSTQAVPEPSIVALTAIGGLLFAARKWFVWRA